MILQLFWWLVFSLTLTAMGEYFVHKYFQHGILSPKWFRSTQSLLFGLSYVWSSCHSHAYHHHQLNENSLVLIDLPLSRVLKLYSPILILLGLISLLGAAVLTITLLSYAYVWTKLHRTIHEVEVSWIVSFPGYDYLRRQHLLHHKDTTKNFGAVFGFVTDYLYNTLKGIEGLERENIDVTK